MINLFAKKKQKLSNKKLVRFTFYSFEKKILLWKILILFKLANICCSFFKDGLRTKEVELEGVREGWEGGP